jgi:hypothetical protein
MSPLPLLISYSTLTPFSSHLQFKEGEERGPGDGDFKLLIALAQSPSFPHPRSLPWLHALSSIFLHPGILALHYSLYPDTICPSLFPIPGHYCPPLFPYPDIVVLHYSLYLDTICPSLFLLPGHYCPSPSPAETLLSFAIPYLSTIALYYPLSGYYLSEHYHPTIILPSGHYCSLIGIIAPIMPLDSLIAQVGTTYLNIGLCSHFISMHYQFFLS